MTRTGTREQTRTKKPFLPPRWFVRLFWKAHRGVFQVTGGRRGLWPAREDKWGTMRVTTVGRRTGEERSVILGYLEDGPTLTTLAMNGWAGPDPAWWLNLQAHPQARIVLKGGARDVVAHAATGEERTRLWARWQSVDKGLDQYAALRSKPTAVVVFEPVDTAA